MSAATPRLFVPDDLGLEKAIRLPPEQSHYLLSVMRRGVGDHVLLFNGRDGEWRAAITDTAKRVATLWLVGRTRAQRFPPDLWLLFAPIKRQRIDLVAEKATELGVAQLQPVITQRTAVERVNGARLQAHAVEAAEQCGLMSVPKVLDPVALDTLLESWDPGRLILYCDEGGAGPPALEFLKGAPPGPWAILIGPEGGFAPGEQAQLRAHPAARPVSLGPRIMRADTAALAALALWQATLGDWDIPPLAGAESQTN